MDDCTYDHSRLVHKAFVLSGTITDLKRASQEIESIEGVKLIYQKSSLWRLQVVVEGEEGLIIRSIDEKVAMIKQAMRDENRLFMVEIADTLDSIKTEQQRLNDCIRTLSAAAIGRASSADAIILGMKTYGFLNWAMMQKNHPDEIMKGKISASSFGRTMAVLAKTNGWLLKKRPKGQSIWYLPTTNPDSIEDELAKVL